MTKNELIKTTSTDEISEAFEAQKHSKLIDLFKRVENGDSIVHTYSRDEIKEELELRNRA